MKLASDKQIKMFFGLGHSLGYEQEILKKSVKLHFGVEHLKELTSEQMRWAIDKLLEEQQKDK